MYFYMLVFIFLDVVFTIWPYYVRKDVYAMQGFTCSYHLAERTLKPIILYYGIVYVRIAFVNFHTM